MDSITRKNQNVNICNKCHEIITNGEVVFKEERHGLPEPPFEEVPCCPHCSGDLTPAFRCLICGEYRDAEDGIGNICPTCRTDHEQNKFTYRLGERYVKYLDSELEFYSQAAGFDIKVEPHCLEDRNLIAWLKERFSRPIHNCSSISKLKEVSVELTNKFKDYIFDSEQGRTDFFQWLGDMISKEEIVWPKP